MISIAGFTYEPKINLGIPKMEPALEYGGNPNQYHAYYRLRPQPGENFTCKHLHLHRVSLARIPHNFAKLEMLQAGSGDLLCDLI